MNTPFTLKQILLLHKKMIDRIGGSHGVRDLNLLDSALAQRFMTFDGNDLYPTEIEKAAVLAYFLTRNHPFVDGNKRVAHAAVTLYLRRNGYQIIATVDEQTELFLSLAAGEISRDDLLEFLNEHTHQVS